MSDKVLVPIWIKKLPPHLAATCHGLPDLGDLAFPMAVVKGVLDAWSAMPVLILGGDLWCLDDELWRRAHAWAMTRADLARSDAPAHSLQAARETVMASWVEPAWHVSFVCRWEP